MKPFLFSLVRTTRDFLVLFLSVYGLIMVVCVRDVCISWKIVENYDGYYFTCGLLRIRNIVCTVCIFSNVQSVPWFLKMYTLLLKEKRNEGHFTHIIDLTAEGC